jgi:hypothetical protein
MKITTLEYDREDQAYAVCKSIWDRENMFKSEFKRKKLKYPPMKNEKMLVFMERCKSDELVNLKFPNRNVRSLFCFREFTE